MYYVIIMKADSQSVIKYNDMESAYEAFHTEMAYAFNQKIATAVMVTNFYGARLKWDMYEGENTTGDEE